MLDRKYINFYARSSKVREDIAERDIALTYVLHILSENILPHLAFKGGTCLKKTYFGRTGRFSMDLDFTSLDIPLEDLRTKLSMVLDKKTHYDIDFKIIDENVGSQSYLAILEYKHKGNPGSNFELQVSYREKPAFSTTELPLLEEMYFKFCEFERFSVNCLQKDEMLSEKIRATFQRMRSRDLYDLFLFSNRPFNRDIVQTLAVIKCWNARDPFNPELLLERLEKADYDWDDLTCLVRRNKLPSQETIIKTVLKKYDFLKDLSDDLHKIIEDSKAHRNEELVKQALSQIQEK